MCQTGIHDETFKGKNDENDGIIKKIPNALFMLNTDEIKV